MTLFARKALERHTFKSGSQSLGGRGLGCGVGFKAAGTGKVSPNECTKRGSSSSSWYIPCCVIPSDIDIGITYIPVPDPQLDFLKVTSIEMGVFTRNNSFQGVPQMELPYVVPVMPLQGVPTKVRGLDGWPEDAYRRKILHRVTLMESAFELCRQGRVAGYFPAFTVREHNKRIKEEYRLERRKSPYNGRTCYADVFIVKRKSYEESGVIKQMAKAIRLICE